ncbi:unnamed protein product [Ambrosiozyma monospora]|uniref:Unnamed protein product n=1 Tax=Ambrosiozyma monospora TaxID=43982 RepID=A0ACB5U8Q2_AMBMO|nr:unnamed protein product [Ambrosiozyma monospora]
MLMQLQLQMQSQQQGIPPLLQAAQQQLQQQQQMQAQRSQQQQQQPQKPFNMNRKTEPPQPRTKVRPCDHCRRRKTKCVMIPEFNSCKMCQTKGLKCTFTEASNSLKRGMSAADDLDNKRMRFEDPTIQPPPNVPVRDVAPIKDYSTIQGSSLLKRTLSLQYPRSSFYIGPTSIYDPIFLSKISLDKIDQFPINKSNSIRKVADKIRGSTWTSFD